MSAHAGDAFARPAASRGAVIGDLDNDGDDDVVVSNNSAAARVLLNRAADAAGHHWIGLRAVVPTAAGRPPRDALGASWWCRADGLSPRHRRVHSADCYASARDPRVRVGLGSHGGPVDVDVSWPGGPDERFLGLAADRYHVLERGQGYAALDPRAGGDRRASRPTPSGTNAATSAEISAETTVDTGGDTITTPSAPSTAPPSIPPRPPEP